MHAESTDCRLGWYLRIGEDFPQLANHCFRCVCMQHANGCARVCVLCVVSCVWWGGHMMRSVCTLYVVSWVWCVHMCVHASFCALGTC